MFSHLGTPGVMLYGINTCWFVSLSCYSGKAQRVSGIIQFYPLWIKVLKDLGQVSA
jgi:hypothetical protein